MKKLWIRLMISLSCLGVILLTLSLIIIFYIATFVRKIFFKKFIPHARRDTIDESEELIGSANAQLNAMKASLERQ